MATLMLTALAVRVRLYSLSGERGHHGRSQASCAAGDLRATHPSHIPQPHTPATYPSHIPQLHLHLHLHLHLQLPIVATPLSCTSYGLLRSYMGMLLHPTVGDLRAQRPRRDLVPADRRRHVRLPQLPYDTYYISYTDYAWYTECT